MNGALRSPRYLCGASQIRSDGRSHARMRTEREPTRLHARRNGMGPSWLLAAGIVVLACAACGSDERPSGNGEAHDVVANGRGSLSSRDTDSPGVGSSVGTRLRIELTNVAWTKVDETVGTNGSESHWRKTGAVVRLTCNPPSISTSYEAAAGRDGEPVASAVCASVASDPRFLTATDQAPCDAAGYWSSTVTVRGTLQGEPLSLQLGTCSAQSEPPADAAQRWLRLVSLATVGPDPG